MHKHPKTIYFYQLNKTVFEICHDIEWFFIESSQIFDSYILMNMMKRYHFSTFV